MHCKCYVCETKSVTRQKIELEDEFEIERERGRVERGIEHACLLEGKKLRELLMMDAYTHIPSHITRRLTS